MKKTDVRFQNNKLTELAIAAPSIPYFGINKKVLTECLKNWKAPWEWH